MPRSTNAARLKLERLGERPAGRVAAGLALLHLALAACALEPAPYVGGDNAAYVALAESLVKWGSYVDLWDPALRPHTQYPPVFPLLLAAAMKVGISGWIGFKLITVACSGLAVAASYLWMRRTTTPGIALGAGALLAILPGPLEIAHHVLSDTPFWALALLALWAAADRVDGRMRWALWAALFTATAYMTRSAGLPLVVALAATFALRRRGRELAILAAVAGIPALLWWLRGRSLGAGGYTAQLLTVNPYQPELGTIDAAGWVSRIGENVAHYMDRHLPLMLGEAGTAGRALAFVLVLLALAGWALRVRRAGAAELFLPLYVGLLLIWPATWSGERFLLPILPLLLVYAAEVVRDAASKARLAPGWAALAFAAPLALVALPATAAELRDGVECSRAYRDGDPLPCLTPTWRDLFSVAMEARGTLPPGSVVLSRKPTLFYILSGYRGRLYATSSDPAAFFGGAREAGAGWVVVDQVPDLAPIYLHPVLLARRDDFCVVPELSLPNAALARIHPGGPPRPADAPANAFRSCPLAGE
jgi:4-amino-4-deoxy-L-arabinose transferase-like glycosyltransferase